MSDQTVQVPAVVVGLGCRPGAGEHEVRALLDTALSRYGARIELVIGYATVAARAREPGLLAVAGPGLMSFPAADLADVPVPGRSPRVLAALGTASVAEAAALRAARVLAPEPARVELVGPKLAGAAVTVALAQVTGHHPTS